MKGERDHMSGGSAARRSAFDPGPSIPGYRQRSLPSFEGQARAMDEMRSRARYPYRACAAWRRRA